MAGRPMAFAAAFAMALFGSAAARAAEPITIGFGMALTGGLAAIGKSALLAMQIWQDDVNAKGGLLGRPVKLINYDDQSNPATVPALYTKLIDIDKVDLTISGYATNMVAPAMPIMIQRNRLFFGLFALAVNSEFHYPKYFSMLPSGPDPKHAFSEPFFEVAMKGDPKPQSLAIAAADAEYPKNASEGARDIAKKLGLKIVYDRTYRPPRPTIPPSCGRSRRATRTSSLSPPTRPIPSAWCGQRTRSGSRPAISAAVWSGCRSCRSSSSSGRC